MKNRIEHVYAIANEAGALLVASSLAQLGFVTTYLAGAYGPAVRLGGVTAQFIKSHTDDSVSLTLAGTPHELSTVERFLGNTPIAPGSQRPVATLLKSQQQEQDEVQAAKVQRARKALADVQARQVKRERERSKRTATWRTRANDVGGIEGRLAAAGYELRAGADGLPCWKFGEAAMVAVRADTDGGPMAEIELVGVPSAFASGYKLITSGQEALWPINRKQVEAKPLRKSVAAWPSEKDRQRIATLAEDILDATDENLRYAIRKLPKWRRQALRKSLART